MYSSAALSIASLTLALLCQGAPTFPHHQQGDADHCRCFPGDHCWPSSEQWNAFNETVNGKLIASVPIAAVCHNSAFGPYDAEKCATLRDNWFFPQTHLPSSSSIMAPFFTNNSCNPFLDPDAPCTLGNYASYAVNASCADDFVKTVEFVRRHNIRLTIRNTGHDYNGKSAGAGALSIWTHHMTDMEIIDYKSSHYNGKALKMGAGVSVEDTYRFTSSHGLVNVGGNCPTVGLAGGYTQGGGHGPLGSRYGLAADQTLEWEVVTGTGEILVASPEQNQDLYWALSGGGGGTYGAVSSLTVKAYPDMTTTAANLTFSPAGIDTDDYWDIVETYLGSLPTLTGGGCYSNFFLTPEVFLIEPSTCPGKNKGEMLSLLKPTLDKLAHYNVSYSFFITEFPRFYDSYVAYNTPWNASNIQLGGRLMPKSLVEAQLGDLVQIFRNSVDNLGLEASAVALDVSQAQLPPGGNAINPAWRTAVFNFLLGTAYDYQNYTNDIVLADRMTHEFLPPMERLTPDGGAYINEADFQQPNFQKTFYGDNYDRLLQIKDKYDPQQIFYALTAVGSERWYADQSRGGRLCTVP